jgi:hypothetical protein
VTDITDDEARQVLALMGDDPTESAIDVVALYCPAESAALEQLRADAQALADVRTLDDWARSGRHVTQGQREVTSFADGEYTCTLFEATEQGESPHWFHGATPDEARAKAAAWVRT